MEISKSLQEEIRAVQNKLKNAIQNHQVYVGKLNGDPNNEELLGQLHEIQEHIISLSKCQKQVVQRLRKEVKLYEAANTNGIKVSIGSLLGINNNNHITNNNETRKTSDADLRTVNGGNLNGLSNRRCSKDDYEDEIKNVDPSFPPSEDCDDNNCQKEMTRFDNLDSNEADVIGVAQSVDNTTKPDDETCEQLDFLGSLGLITSDKHAELQNKRAERKRRSTANPQFVYSNWEIPTKRKRHCYLQSNGTAPQTRQTTARLNGPSPPPNKTGNLKPPSPPSKAGMKSLIPTQKSTTRPNILRNNSESKLFSGKIKSENGLTKSQQQQQQQQQPISAVNKSVQSIANKAVHIPGLPSSLTIERIENDSSAVCIHCRNPGSLTVCENCKANYHVSCHMTGGVSGSQKFCPKCYAKTKERDRDRDAGSSSSSAMEFKQEDETATTSDASGVVGKTGKNTEVDKTVGGFYQADATEERASIPSAIGINQLPSSTFLIPIVPNSIPIPIPIAIASCSGSGSGSSSFSSSTVDVIQSENFVAKPVANPANKEEQKNGRGGGAAGGGTSYSSILINELSHSSGVQSGGQTTVSYTYKLPVAVVQSEKSTQSYLLVKKISESSTGTGTGTGTGTTTVGGGIVSSGRNKQQIFESSKVAVGSKPERRRRSTSSIFDYQQFSSTGYNDHDQSEIKSISCSSNKQKIGDKRGEKKFYRNNRDRIGDDACGEDGERKSSFKSGCAIEGESRRRGGGGGEEEKEEEEKKGEGESGGGGGGGDGRRAGKFHSKLNISQLRSASRNSNSFISLHSIITNNSESLDKSDNIANKFEGSKIRQPVIALPNTKSKTNLLYSLFSSNNESDTFSGCIVKPENSTTATAAVNVAVVERGERDERKLDTEGRKSCGGGGGGDTKRAESEPRFNSPSSSSISEYVKLEEAHLPAPLRPNLGVKNVEEIRAILSKKIVASTSASSSPSSFPSSFSSSPSPSPSPSSSPREVECSEPIPRTENRNDIKKSKNLMSFKDCHDESLRETLDFIATERKHSNNYIKFHDFDESDDDHDDDDDDDDDNDDLFEKFSKNINRKNKSNSKDSNIATGVVAQLSRNNSYPVLKNKLLPNDEIIADFERQDLPINDRRSSTSKDEKKDLVEDKVRKNTLPVGKGKSKLGINIVSTENMLVLEQFESAMLEADDDETANC